MKVSHIIYKVADLQESVEAYREQGFTVEYGHPGRPYNALIYFSEGPFLELLAGTKMPAAVKKMLHLFGKGKLADRLDAWDAHPGGPCALALENYRQDFASEKQSLARYGIKLCEIPSRRKDVHGRKLRFKVAYPDDLRLPFFMNYFNIDPKPKNYIHPNGIVGLREVTFGTAAELIPLMQELCDDPRLILEEGDGIKDFKYLYAEEGQAADRS